MKCAECHELLSGHVDGELMAAESQNVRDHVAECAECARELEMLERTSTLLRQRLVRHSAPDVLKARIRSALAQPDAFDPPVRRSAFALGATRGSRRHHCGGEQRSDLWGAVARERIALSRRRGGDEPCSLIDAGASH